MQLSLKNHKANIFEKYPFDSSKQSIIFLPGAGMDHRILSMFNLENLKDHYNVLGFDFDNSYLTFNWCYIRNERRF